MHNIKLNIVFHNPNTVEETVAELVKIAAETAKSKISSMMIHNAQSQPDTAEYEEEIVPQLSM